MEMATKDPRIDAYIAKAQPFAKPILRHLRAVVHEACPDVEETIKWGVPHFQYRDGMMCGMAAFKAHCAFGFWRSKQVVGDSTRNAEAMGDFGRITAVEGLPARSRIKALVKAAMRLNESGVRRVPRKKTAPRKPAAVPRDLASALDGDAKAKATFDAFPPSQRREYIEWITEAKAAATRERRLATAIEWLAEGKRRHWKYEA
jgi:uncharacterized protein YdeI (YjbR/CyaY-like superfamily)